MSIQFLTTGFMLRSGMCCVALTSASVWAVDERPYDFQDLILDVSSAPVPKVKENTTSPASGTTHYDWDGTRANGLEFSLVGKEGTSLQSTGGWQYGLALNVGNYNITPTSYTVAGTSYNNGSGDKLYYRTLGVDLVAGYEYGIVDMDDFTGIVEVTPILGVGLAEADNQVQSNGVYSKKTGIGEYFDIGLRVGAYITEMRWIYGINVTYQANLGVVKMSMPGGYNSTLHFVASGVGFGFAAGYRF
jgi:hypothetical protein